MLISREKGHYLQAQQGANVLHRLSDFSSGTQLNHFHVLNLLIVQLKSQQGLYFVKTVLPGSARVKENQAVVRVHHDFQDV